MGETSPVQKLIINFLVTSSLVCASGNIVIGYFYTLAYGSMSTRDIILVMLVAASGGVLITCLTGVVNIKRFFRPIGIAASFINQIADRNLSQTLEDYDFSVMDFMKIALEQMTDEIRRLIVSISQGIQTAHYSEEVMTSTTGSISDTAAVMSSMVAQMITICGEQRETASTIIDHSEQVKQMTAEMVQRADTLEATVKLMASRTSRCDSLTAEQQNSIKNSRDAIEDMGRSMGELSDISHQIQAFLEVIASIAAQTNLLAVNASIEAARSGEAGHGFRWSPMKSTN